MAEAKRYIARYGDGERIVAGDDDLERCLTDVRERGVPELWLIPASPTMQLGSMAMRVFGLKPRPAVVVQFGPSGALVTFRDRHGGDYRVVNRDYEGQPSKGPFRLHDRRSIAHRTDEVLTIDVAFSHVREFFAQGDRPWRLACRPVAV